MNITNIKIRYLLFIVLGFLVLTGTTANGLLFLTVWEEYQVQETQSALFKVIGSVALGAVSTIIVIATILILTKYFRTPLHVISELMMKISHGDLTITIPYQKHNNEFGDMARTLEMFREKLLENKKLTEAQERENQKKIEKVQHVEKSIDDFDQHMQQFMTGVRASMDDLVQTSQQLAQIASGSLKCAQDLQQSSGQASENTSVVYDAAHNMLSSISDVSKNIDQSERISHEAKTKANHASQSIADLQEAAEKIDDVISLINDISTETNMLALNAAIEAERAGIYGKSFAVVASEVKKLATETSEATNEIRGQVETVKIRVAQSVDNINDIENVINQMNDTMTLVTQSMQHQTQTSHDIADNAKNAVSVSNTVRQTSDNVYDSAKETESSSEVLNEVSEELLSKTDKLCREIQDFFKSIK